VRRLEEEHRRERVLEIRLVLPWGRVARRTTSQVDLVPEEHNQHPTGVPETSIYKLPKWRRVRNPDCWNGVNGGFNPSNAKMVCRKCHREFPFDLRCQNCGSSQLVLDTNGDAWDFLQTMP
jgi:hypothetical protein